MLKHQLLLFALVCLMSSCAEQPEIQNVPEDTEIPIKEITFDGAKTKGRVWVQKEFVLSTFNGVPPQKEYFPQAIANLKNAGFNYIETAWRNTEDTKAILEECDRQGGLKVIAQDMSTLGGFADRIARPYHEDSITKVLSNFGHFNSLAAIYVYDEPKQEQFHIVKNNTNSLEQRRADLLGFTVLLQSYSPWYQWDNSQYVSFDKYVDKYMDEVAPAVLSTDYYSMRANTTNESFAKDNFWRDISYMRKKTLEKDVIFWFYYQGVGNTSNLDPSFITAAQIRVQAWSAIMYGAKGLQSYCASYGVIDSTGNQGPLFSGVREMNGEIASIGNILLALKSRAVYHGCSLVNDPFKDKIDSSKYISSLSEFISVGEFSDGHNNDYLLILNRNFIEPFSGAIPLRNNLRIYRCPEDIEKLYIQSNVINLNLDSGQAVLYRIEQTTAIPQMVKYYVKN